MNWAEVVIGYLPLASWASNDSDLDRRLEHCKGTWQNMQKDTHFPTKVVCSGKVTFRYMVQLAITTAYTGDLKIFIQISNEMFLAVNAIISYF